MPLITGLDFSGGHRNYQKVLNEGSVGDGEGWEVASSVDM